MKRYIWQPIAFFAAGFGFYLYNGITWNTWLTYLPFEGVLKRQMNRGELQAFYRGP